MTLLWCRRVQKRRFSRIQTAWKFGMMCRRFVSLLGARFFFFVLWRETAMRMSCADEFSLAVSVVVYPARTWCSRSRKVLLFCHPLVTGGRLVPPDTLRRRTKAWYTSAGMSRYYFCCYYYYSGVLVLLLVLFLIVTLFLLS